MLVAESIICFNALKFPRQETKLFSKQADTHDGSVPDEVFELLQKAVPLMPQLKFVVLEQLSMALGTEEEKQRFRSDFEKMNKILKSERYPKLSGHRNAFLPTGSFPAVPRVEDLLLHEQQVALSNMFLISFFLLIVGGLDWRWL